MRKIFMLLPLLGVLFLTGCSLSTPVLILDERALGGYDVVAYHLDNKAVKGNNDFTSTYQGGTWYFANQNNKELFEADPVRYLPQYGGYCAYAMANGFVVDSDPEAFSLVGDKLYLNYSTGVRDTWLKNRDHYIQNADRSWQKKIAK